MTYLLLIAAVVGGGAFGARFFPTEEMLQDRFALGQKYYAANDHENSVQVFSEIEKTPNFALLKVDSIEVEIGDLRLPIRVAATYQLGNSHRNVGLSKLERSRRALAEGDSAVSRARRIEAEEAFNAGKGYYRRLVDERVDAPQSLRAMSFYQVVRSSYQMEDYGAVVDEVHEMLRRFPGSAYEVAALYDEGWAHYWLGAHPEAVSTFDRLLEVSDDALKSDRALYQTGESFFALKEYDPARARYRRLVDAYDFGSLSDKELQEMKTQRLRGLVQETTRELVAKAQIRVGDAFAAEGRVDSAIAAYSEVPRRFAAEDLLVQKSFDNMAGMVFERQGTDAGVAVLRQAIEQVADPVFRGRAQLKIANAFYADGDYPAAVAEYRVYGRAYGEYAATVGVALDQVDFLQAEAYRMQGDAEALRQARALYEALLRDYPASPRRAEAQYGLGLALRGLDQTASARDAFAETVDRHPRAPVAPYALNWQARLAFAAGEAEVAENLYRRLIEEYPDAGLSDLAWKDLGLVYKQLGRFDAAVAAFGRVGADAPMWGKVQAEGGDMLLGAGRHEEIETHFDLGGAAARARAENDRVTLAELHYIQGRIARERGQRQAEIAAFDAALAHSENPQLDVFALFFRGLAHYQEANEADARGDTLAGGARFEHAVADLERLLGLEPPADLRDVAYRTRGVALTRLGRSAEAVDAYRLLIEEAADPQERGEFELMLMELYYDQGDFEATETVARRLAAQGGAAGERAYFVLVSLLLEQERYAETVDTATKALALYPRSEQRAAMMSVRARGLFFGERYEEAVGAFGGFIAAYPAHADLPSAHYQLGYAHEILGQYEEAAAAFVALADRFPDDQLAADALYRAGENRYNSRQFAQALEAYGRLETVYAQSEFAAKGLYSAAWTHMDLEAEEESIGAMRRLVGRYPRSEFARYAQFSIGDYYYSQKDYRQAQQAYRGVVEGYAGSPEADKAAQLLLDLDEDLASLEYDKAFADFDRGNFTAAVEGFDALIRQYPNTYSALAALANKGVALENLGDNEAARSTYEGVIAAATQDDDNANLVEFAKLRLDNL